MRTTNYTEDAVARTPSHRAIRNLQGVQEKLCISQISVPPLPRPCGGRLHVYSRLMLLFGQLIPTTIAGWGGGRGRRSHNIENLVCKKTVFYVISFWDAESNTEYCKKKQQFVV